MNNVTSPQSRLATALNQLSASQQIYVAKRIAGASQSLAAKQAGLGPTYKDKTSKNVSIVLEEVTKRAAAKLEVTRADVLQGLMDATRMATTATELVMAWREVGKLIGAYEPTKVEVTHSVMELTRNQLAQLSDEELLRLAKQPEQYLEAQSIDSEGSDERSHL